LFLKFKSRWLRGLKKENRKMAIQVNKTYMIYGKMGNMKRFRPVSNTGFCVNLIYAELFTITNEEVKEKFEKELEYLKNQGNFEAREVKLGRFRAI